MGVPNPPYREIRCDSMPALFDVLRWTHPVWRGRPMRTWAFRGQRNGHESWSLTPSVLRSQKVKFRNTVEETPQPTYKEQLDLEHSLVRGFLRLADEVGLPVPQSALDYFQTGGNTPGYPAAIWPGMEVWEAVALSQHHGIPTRFLDFTSDPLVALYFAAADAKWHFDGEQEKDELVTRCCGGARYERNLPDTMAIWAVDIRFIQEAWEQWTPLPTGVQIVEVARASNPYLHAQGGFFIYDVQAGMDLGTPSHQKESLALDKRIIEEATRGLTEEPGRFDDFLPAVVKITAPAHLKFLMDVVEQLGKERYTTAKMKPSYDQVAETVKKEFFGVV